MLQHLHALPTSEVILLRWPDREASCRHDANDGLNTRILKHKNTKKYKNTPKIQKYKKTPKNTKYKKNH
jgi:hypothetical protein